MVALWIVWSVLTLVVISLAVARKVAVGKEDEYVHLSDAETAAIPQQLAIANKVEKLDTWGKRLTVVDLVFGLVLVGMLCYQTWQQTSTLPN